MEPPELTFIIKPVYPVNTGTLMVSPQYKKVFRVLDFVCEQEADRFCEQQR